MARGPARVGCRYGIYGVGAPCGWQHALRPISSRGRGRPARDELVLGPACGRRTGLGGGHPQAVGKLCAHLLPPCSRLSGGRVHRRIPRTARLSTVCTARLTPFPPSSTSSCRRTQNPQPVDNFRAQPGYDRPAPRPPFFPRSPPTGATSCPRRGKPADQGEGPSPGTFAHTPFTACG